MRLRSAPETHLKIWQLMLERILDQFEQHTLHEAHPSVTSNKRLLYVLSMICFHPLRVLLPKSRRNARQRTRPVTYDARCATDRPDDRHRIDDSYLHRTSRQVVCRVCRRIWKVVLV